MINDTNKDAAIEEQGSAAQETININILLV